ncbi:MAG: SDR family NAD(P)-dependent oxidoreductase, partial [Frankia sp.]|nr:SDR family NAD(P)-dependent oxidoreductase [Frankia sp.]
NGAHANGHAGAQNGYANGAHLNGSAANDPSASGQAGTVDRAAAARLATPRPGGSAAQAPVAGQAPAGAPLGRAAVFDVVVEVIGSQTGYPAEMLEPGLDLEADLSIDSIKRTEILGELAGRLGLADGSGGELPESVVEELAAIKTVDGIVDWIVEHPGTGADGDIPGHAGPAGGGGGSPVLPAGAVPVQLAPPAAVPALAGAAVAAGGGHGPAMLFAAPATAAAVPAARPGGAAVAALDRAAVVDVVVEVIGSQTGYPAEMLEPGLDLEADLSIDSIKRTEILGELATRLGLADGPGGELPESVVAELAAIKTVDGIADWIVRNAAGQPARPAAAQPARAETFPLRRYVVEPELLPSPPSWADQLAGDDRLVAGGRFAVVDGGLGVGLALADLLEQAGAEVRLVDAEAPDLIDQLVGGAAADGLLWVAALDAAEGSAATLPAAFAALRAAVLGGTRRLVLASGLGGDFGRSRAGSERAALAGAGFAGLVRTIGQELPEITVRLVDVEPKEAPARLAEWLLAEMFAPQAPPVVGYRDGQRRAPRVRPADLPAGADSSSAPGWALAGLGPSSVVLLTGGARGITARFAVELARRTGAHIELVGRTPPPTEPESPVTAGAFDAPALRRALIESGLRRPAEIEARIARLLAEREVRATLTELGRTAASVRYHAVDVRDERAMRAVVADIYDRHGRLDGVVHGAGVLEDRLLRDKTPESFARVYSTKVDGARALLSALRPDRAPAFVVLFGSVAGVFGNRGQVDYAAANDTLDALAHACSGSVAGRVVSVDWGPWGAGDGAGRGMVSPELEREYARRGIGLIDPRAGVAALLAELGLPAGAPAQVVYMCGEVTAFHGAG